MTMRFSPVERLGLRGDGVVQSTQARDTYFDSRSWSVVGNVDTRLGSSVFLTLSGTYQRRTFVNRTAGLDGDGYWQVGAGPRYVVTNAWTASARYGYSQYEWPDGNETGSHRLAVAVQYAWGRRDVPPPSRVDRRNPHARARSVQSPTERQRAAEVKAPHAGVVTVAGDFNHWDRSTRLSGRRRVVEVQLA
jgi:hypothetical protein